MKFLAVLHEGPIKVTSGRRAGINGMGTLKMIGLSYLLGVLAALSVIIAGVYAYKAATTEPTVTGRLLHRVTDDLRSNGAV